MQYSINSDGLLPNEHETEAIDAKIGLSLGRFNNIISSCDVNFQMEKQQDGNIMRCHIHVILNNSSDFVVSDSGKDKVESFRSALERIKRNIERHLKRQNISRTSKSLGNRLS